MVSMAYVLGRAFSSDEEVVENVGKLLRLLAVSSFLDSTQAVLSGIVRGSGWQMFGAFINLGSFYIVGLPISCMLGFLTPLQAEDLWIGLICAPFVQILLLAYITWRADWEEEVKTSPLELITSLGSCNLFYVTNNQVVRAQKRIESSSLSTSFLLT